MVSIIIATYNAQGFISPCLDSLFSQEYKDFEVIVIDNNSQDGTTEFIKDNYPAIKLIQNNQNKGAAAARNQGLEVATGEYVLVLDCDVVLENDFLGQIVKVVENSDNRLGMVQPKIFGPDEKTIFSTGIHLSRLRRFYDIGRGQVDNGQFDRQKYIFGACCAAALYKREMLEDIKQDDEYFDNDFFFLVEDVDLAWRAQKKGWKALYVPSAACYHSGNSSGYPRDLRQYLSFRNRYLMMLKNDGILGILIRLPLLIFYDIPRFIYLLSTNRYLWSKAQFPQ